MSVPGNGSTDTSTLLGHYVFLTYCSVYISLLPVFIAVILVGLQRHRNPRSRPATHCDVFTYNMAAIDVFAVISCALYISSFVTRLGGRAAQSLSHMTFFGQVALHLLVCLERFLAVVHPITYLQLKQRGVATRNASIVLIWLLSCGVVCLFYVNEFIPLYLTCITGLGSLTVITFFCFRVLCVLIGPGPGDRAEDRRSVDPVKRTAFYTIAAITLAFMLKFVGMSLGYIMYFAGVLNDSQQHVLAMSAQWFNLPCSLVLPLPFLYRQIKQRRRKK